MGQPPPSPGFPQLPGQGQEGGIGNALDEVGSFEGVNFRVNHRDTNTILTCYLQPGYAIKSRSNSMISMSSTVQMSGQFKVSLKNLLSTGQLSQSTYQGPGEVVLAPHIWGDIVPIRMDGQRPWYLGHHAYIASTMGIQWTAQSQGWKKGLFSGDGMFVAQVMGVGLLFVQAIGALVKKDLGPGEEIFIDRGHLVAWNCPYRMEKLGAGGFMSRLASGEWWVCRFTGPGTIYMQSRNPEHIIEWISSQLPSN